MAKSRRLEASKYLASHLSPSQPSVITRSYCKQVTGQWYVWDFFPHFALASASPAYLTALTCVWCFGYSVQRTTNQLVIAVPPDGGQADKLDIGSVPRMLHLIRQQP
ncbi:unnamed protein product [Protopolystoma xenopodis]|uniref:Uncharacterized protein n=1 Tax=Protopolystoma xenopodis TaxID=117903 RepID=A0A448WPX9_9PLAT|nr:unnamed protein product [Protopolystoma xenopodis]